MSKFFTPLAPSTPFCALAALTPIPVGSRWAAACVCAALTLAAAPAGAQAARSAASTQQLSDYIVAVVGSEPITNQEVQAMHLRLTREAGEAGEARPTEQAAKRALEALIEERAQLQLASEIGIQIGSDQLDVMEANVAANNQLSREGLHKRLADDGVSLTAFREQMRVQVTLTRLREREVDGRIRISEPEIDQHLREMGATAQVPTPEIQVAMLLLAVPEGASEAQVQALQQQAALLARRARAGEDFAALVKAHSQAPDKGEQGGDMGWRLPERYPDLFAQAVAPLPVGAVTDPLRSGAGFHVLKLLGRRSGAALLSVPQTRARHILLRTTPDLNRDQAVAQLQRVRAQLVSGQASFARVAEQLSQDGSASQGGDLGWARKGQFVPEFEQVMERLQPGQISEPLVSRFGVHLIEVMERGQGLVPEKEQRDLARNALVATRAEAAHERWLQDVRSSAYVELRETPRLQAPPQPPAR